MSHFELSKVLKPHIKKSQWNQVGLIKRFLRCSNARKNNRLSNFKLNISNNSSLLSRIKSKEWIYGQKQIFAHSVLRFKAAAVSSLFSAHFSPLLASFLAKIGSLFWGWVCEAAAQKPVGNMMATSQTLFYGRRSKSTQQHLPNR